MNCPDVRHLLEPYADGELDLVRRLQIEEHLAACPQCAEQEAHLLTLRIALSSPTLYCQPPAALRGRIQRAMPPVAGRRRRSWLRWSTVAAGILLLIGTVAILSMLWSRAGMAAEDRLAAQVVASHVRSLQVEHLLDVASTDRHTVKPWFRGKLDYSPPVPDFAAQGYALTGGRLDYLAERPVAALVYQRRAHIINLFIWPAGNEGEKAMRSVAQQGFHVRHWQRYGLKYWAVTDLNEEELDDFVRLVQEQALEAHP